MPRGKRKASEMDEVDENPKLTKREKRVAAIARAKLAMAADKKKVKAVLAKKEGRPAPEEPKPVRKKARSTPVKESPKRPTRAMRTYHPSTSDEEMDDASVEGVKPAAEIKSQVESQPTHTSSNMKSPPRYASPSIRTQNMNAVVALPTPQDEEEDDDDDEMPPPPMPNLEAQISQQVMANIAAMEENKPTPYTVPPLAAFEHTPEDGDEPEKFVHDENPIVIDEDYYPEETNKSFLTMRTIFLSIVVVIIGVVAMQEDTVSEVGLGTAAGIEPPCFKDNVIVDQDTGIVNSCADTGGVECPDGGTCRWGTLVECIGKHYEISDNKDNCVLTAQSKEKVCAIQAVLEEKTLNGGCHISVDEYPMFPYKEVQVANPMVIANDALELSILENEFNVQRANGILLIGLKSDYKLNTPMHCKAASAVRYVLGIFGKFLIASLHFLLSMVFSLVLEAFSEYPIQSGIALVGAFVVRLIFQYRSYRKQLADDVSEIRQIAYDYLEDTPEKSHLVLHVRDHIVMNIYPKHKRKYLIKEVWPRVVPDFKADNRIRKVTRSIENQPREAWQWVAAVSARKKPRNIQ